MPLRGVFVEFQSLSKSRRVQTSELPKKAYFLRTIVPIFFSRDGNWKKTPCHVVEERKNLHAENIVPRISARGRMTAFIFYWPRIA